MTAPYYPNGVITPNLGLALYSIDEIIANNFIILDAFAGTAQSIQVNGTVIPQTNFIDSATVTFTVVGSNVTANAAAGFSMDINGTPVANPNFNNLAPAAPLGGTNVLWQHSGSGVSAYVVIPPAGVFPVTKAAVASNWLNSYSAVTGLFTATQPSFSDISGTASSGQIPSLDASKITTGQLALAHGGTAADLSGTGGAHFVLRQSTVGGVITVSQLAYSDLSGSAPAPAWAALTGTLSSGQVIPYADAGISRLAGSSLAIGNGAAADASGNLSLESLTVHNQYKWLFSEAGLTARTVAGDHPIGEFFSNGPVGTEALELAPTCGIYWGVTLDSLSGSNQSTGIGRIMTGLLGIGAVDNGAWTVPSTNGNLGLTTLILCGPQILNSFATPPTTPTRNDYTGSVGYNFTVSIQTAVNNIGRLYTAGSTHDHDVRLYSSVLGTGTPLASGTILAASASDGNGFKWVNVQAALIPGVTYTLAIDETSGGDTWKAQWVPSLQSGFTVVNALYGNTGLYPNSVSSGAAGSILDSLAVGYTIINDTGISRLGAASLAVGNGTASDVTGKLTLGSLVATAAAPTVAAAQIGYGSTTSATANTTGGGLTLPPLAAGYIIVNIAGTNYKVAYYAA